MANQAFITKVKIIRIIWNKKVAGRVFPLQNVHDFFFFFKEDGRFKMPNRKVKAEIRRVTHTSST